ncbi:hypothetical protein QZH41_002839 [Actinostola sp. cb2023]|nr:hypothetical protein QZH41_002839 [Actinostola sp. cb2023]
METLYDYWTSQMTGTRLNADDLPEFPEGEEYLRGLWETPAPLPDFQKISKTEIWNALRPLDGNKAPGYDGLTYFAYKHADRQCLLTYWDKLFRWLHKHQVMLPSWKIGLQVFLPKANKEDYALAKSWRPITLYPTVFKIACAVITKRVVKQMARSGQWSPAQKGGLPGISGTTDATFIMRSCVDHHRRNQTDLYVLLLDISNAFGSLELGLIDKSIDLTCVEKHMKGWWKDSIRGCSVHLKSDGNLSKRIQMTRGVGQGNTNSALTFNIVKNTVNLWVAQECLGYMVFDTPITDLSYIDDEALIAGSINDLEHMLAIHKSWSLYASLKYDPKKCNLLAEECRDRKFSIPNPKLEIEGKPISRCLEHEEATYLGIVQNFGRPAGSGKRVEGEDPSFLRKVEEKIVGQLATIQSYSKLHARNQLELIDSNVRSVATFAIQALEVSDSYLLKLDRHIYGAVRKTIGLGRRQGSRCMLEAPTKLRGLRVKSLIDTYEQALICNAYRWINNTDRRVVSIFFARGEAHRITCGIAKDDWGELFLNYGSKEGVLPVNQISADNSEWYESWAFDCTQAKPRLQFQSGRTLYSLIFRAAHKYRIRIDAMGAFWIPFKETWHEVYSIKDLRRHLRKYHLTWLVQELSDTASWCQWRDTIALSSKSYRWIRRDLVRDQQYQTGCKMLLNELPCRSVKAVWMKRSHDQALAMCPLCRTTRETVKHILCACPQRDLANIRNARHNKVVAELEIWLKIAFKEGRLKHGQFHKNINEMFQIDRGDQSLEPDLLFTFIKNGRRRYVVWEVTVTMDNAMSTAKQQKIDKYQRWLTVKEDLLGVEIEFEVLVFGVMGGIPQNFEKLLHGVTKQSKTDWVIDEIHKAILHHNYMLWCKRDRLVRL